MKNPTWNELAYEKKAEKITQIQDLIDLELCEINEVSGGSSASKISREFPWSWKKYRPSPARGGGGRKYVM